jgi:mono/diheme cytochrome c family protein
MMKRLSDPTFLLAHRSNVEKYGYVPAPADSWNPDGMPVGFAKGVDTDTGLAWFGFTCAACHTNKIDYQGTSMVIDGAPTTADFTRFQVDLAAAMQATINDQAKFDRFARNVLGSGYSPTTKADLERAFQKSILTRTARNQLNMPTVPYGPARLDAVGAILNDVMSYDLGIPENRREANAPVSYPFLWGTPQSDVVQWPGFAPNASIGPLVRNTGEVLGVFGRVNIKPGLFHLGYDSSVEVNNLGRLEEWLKTLRAPAWPTGVFPAVDGKKAARGQLVYQQNCVQCHQVIARTATDTTYDAVMVPVSEIGTDPTSVDNLLTRTGATGVLEGHNKLILGGGTFGPQATGVEILANAVIGTILEDLGQTIMAGLEEYMKVPKAPKFDPRSYKARPLNGIWATAPYLHNGSVPNLYQLLLPAAQRVKSFGVGSRNFDPVNVGFETTIAPGGYTLDTTLPGNSNAGHDHGAPLTDAQRYDLIEYLKTL